MCDTQTLLPFKVEKLFQFDLQFLHIRCFFRLTFQPASLSLVLSCFMKNNIQQYVLFRDTFSCRAVVSIHVSKSVYKLCWITFFLQSMRKFSMKLVVMIKRLWIGDVVYVCSQFDIGSCCPPNDNSLPAKGDSWCPCPFADKL